MKPGGRAIALPGGGSVKVPQSSVTTPKRARICVGTSRRKVSGSNLRTTTGTRTRALRMRGGRLKGPATLRLPFKRTGLKTQGLPVKDVVTIAYYDAKRRTWQTVPTTVDVRRRQLVARIDHFSVWDDAVMKVSEVAVGVNQTVGEWAGQRAPEAACTSGRGVPDWASLVVNNGAELPIRTCAEGGDGDSTVVQIVNNRPYGMVLRYGTGVSFGWHASPGGLGGFTSRVIDGMMGPGELYLPPLTRASVGIPRSAFGFAQFQASVTGDSLLGDALNLAMEGVPGVDGLSARAAAAMTSKLVAKCSKYVQVGVDGDRVTVKLDTDFLSVLGSTAGCVAAAIPELAADGAFDKVNLAKLESRAKLLTNVQKGFKLLAVAQFSGKLATFLRDTQFNLLGANASFSIRSRDAPAPAPDPVPQPQPWTFDTGGYGPVRIGMTKADVERLVGKRLQTDPNGLRVCWNPTGESPFTSPTYVISPDSDRVTAITFYNGNRGATGPATSTGLKLGDPIARALALYGPAARDTGNRVAQGPSVIVKDPASSSELGIHVGGSERDDLVGGFAVGELSEEYCS